MRRLTLLLIVLVCLFLPAGTAIAEADRPNVVLILADDLGHGDLGVTGSDYHLTPRLDALAAESVRFTRAYTNAPNCAPTRAALMSGMYAPRTGIYTVGNSARGKAANRKLVPTPNETDLRQDIVTLPEALKSAGYRTGIFGKWHLGDDPTEQGFDTRFMSGKQGHPASYHGPFDAMADSTKSDYLDDVLTDAAIEFLPKSGDNQPFFLYLPHYTVHTPIQPEASRLAAAKAREKGKRHKRADYAAMVESLDHNVGRVLDALADRGLAENTVVIFLSDNGGHEGVTTMEPLRGAKGQLYEGGLRTPLFVRWGNRFQPADVAEPVLSFDLYPTLIELAAARLPEQPCDARSLVPLLYGKGELAEQRDALFFHFPAYLQRSDPKNPWRTTPTGAMVAGDYKLIEFFEDGSLELYDLEIDPGETRNLAAETPELTRRLHEMLKAWRSELRAPVPTELNPAFVGRD